MFLFINQELIIFVSSKKVYHNFQSILFNNSTTFLLNAKTNAHLSKNTISSLHAFHARFIIKCKKWKSLQVETLELRDFRRRQHLIGCDYVIFHCAVHKSLAQRFLFHE